MLFCFDRNAPLVGREHHKAFKIILLIVDGSGRAVSHESLLHNFFIGINGFCFAILKRTRID